MTQTLSRRRLLAAAGAAGASSLLAPGARATPLPRYLVQDLGDLGGDNVRVADINAHGLGTGMATRKPADNRGVAFLSRDGRMRGLPPAGRGTPSYGTGVNDAGWACGFDGTNGVRQPARAWLFQGGERRHLPGAPDEDSFARALNADGTVTGSAGTDAFVYHPAEDRLQRLALARGFGAAQGRDLNDEGQVVGEMWGTVGRRAFLWVGDRAEPLDIPGSAEHGASGINRAAQICGTLRHAGADAVDRAFIWQAGSTHELGSLDGEDAPSQALGLNDTGWVVGRAARPGRRPGQVEQCAFVWRAGVMADLNLLVDPRSGPGWRLSTAVAINRHGQIVGQGRLHGRQRSWLATPVA